jgi:hypothetical protein
MLGALAGIALTGGAFRYCYKPDAVVALADSALAHAIEQDETIAYLRDSAATLEAEGAAIKATADSLARAAALSKAQARTFHKALDSARTAADSVPVLVAVVAAQDSALMQDSLAYAGMASAYESLSVATGQLRAALAVSQGQSRELASALRLTRDAYARASRRCRLLTVGAGYTLSTAGHGPGITIGASCRL